MTMMTAIMKLSINLAFRLLLRRSAPKILGMPRLVMNAIVIPHPNRQSRPVSRFFGFYANFS
ncbi:MAG: hypothetical protein K2H64_06600 [Desulfovibrio sp.]|nr:hypothetical protein [Desulfovibrio sp.]